MRHFFILICFLVTLAVAQTPKLEPRPTPSKSIGIPCAESLAQLVRIEPDVPQFRYQYSPSHYDSARYSKFVQNQGTLFLGKGRELRLFVIGLQYNLGYFVNGKQLASGWVRRSFAELYSQRRLVFHEARTEELNTVLKRLFPESRGLIPARFLRAVGLKPLSSIGTSAHDLLTLANLVHLKLEPGKVEEMDLVLISNRDTTFDYMQNYLRWRQLHPTLTVTTSVMDSLLENTQSVRYAKRIAEVTGHRVVAVMVGVPPRSDAYDLFASALIRNDYPAVHFYFPNIVLTLAPR